MYRLFTDLRLTREPAVIEGLNLHSFRTTATTSASTTSTSSTATAATTIPILPLLESTEEGEDEGSGSGSGSVRPPLTMVDRPFTRPPCILSAAQIVALEELLPPDMRFCDWTLKYKCVYKPGRE